MKYEKICRQLLDKNVQCCTEKPSYHCFGWYQVAVIAAIFTTAFYYRF